MKRRAVLASVFLLALAARPVSGQDSFTFVVATPAPAVMSREPGATPFAMLAGPRLDPLAGGRWTSGLFTVVGAEDIRYHARDGRQTRQTELLMDIAHAHSLTVAIGSGVRTGAGTNVLVSRVGMTAGSAVNRIAANVILERPFSATADNFDVITTAGWNRHVARGLALGVEGLAKDLEGLWNPHESDGGARVFLGPSATFNPRQRPWTLHLTAGADFRGSRSDAAPGRSAKSTFAMQVSATYGFR